MDLNIKTKFTFMVLSFMSRVSALEKKEMIIRYHSSKQNYNRWWDNCIL